MDQPLRAPCNRSAELQYILRLVCQGHILWTSDQIPAGKLPSFVKKWESYRLLADPAARAYRKQTGRGSTHLILEHQFNTLDVQAEHHVPVHWLMLGTPGREGLGDDAAHPGPVWDATCKEQRLEWMGYQLTRQPKHFTTRDGLVRTETTWTWRLPGRRYAEWEALLISAAKKRDYPEINKSFAVLKSLPMFAGIRIERYC